MNWQENVEDIAVGFCTAPDRQTAERLGQELVQRRLAACVNVIEGLRSIYRWEQKLCNEPEVLLVIKTSHNKRQKVAECIAALHSYQTPEVIFLPVGSGLGAYLDWVRKETSD